MRKHLSTLAALALGCACICSGCADGNSAEVRGTVTFNGKPIEKGVISFYPVDTTTGKPEGGPIADGRYAVRAPRGLTKVSISMPERKGEKKLYNTPDSKSYPIYKEGLPDKYNVKTELRLEVPAGGVTKDWELTSK